MSDTTTPALTAPAAPAPGTAEYNAAMIAKAEGNVHFPAAGLTNEPTPPGSTPPAGDPPAATPKPPKPDWVPEKFWDADKGEVRTEALAKSYAELEKGRTKPQEPPKAPDGQPPPADPNAAQPPSLDALIARAGDEYTEKGELTVETYEALAKAGIPKERVDAYVEGVVARAELQRTKVFSEVGGEDKYAAMTDWAKTNLTAEQIEAFNAAVSSGNLATTVGAVRNLKAIYDAANGSNPGRRVAPDGSSDGTAGSPHFKSDAELTAAIADPRYRTDPSYRAEVERKIAESDRLGVQVGARLILGKQKQ